MLADGADGVAIDHAREARIGAGAASYFADKSAGSESADRGIWGVVLKENYGDLGANPVRIGIYLQEVVCFSGGSRSQVELDVCRPG